MYIYIYVCIHICIYIYIYDTFLPTKKKSRLLFPHGHRQAQGVGGMCLFTEIWEIWEMGKTYWLFLSMVNIRLMMNNDGY